MKLIGKAIIILMLIGIISSCGSHKSMSSSSKSFSQRKKKTTVQTKKPKQEKTQTGKLTSKKEIISKYESLLSTNIDNSSFPIYQFVENWLGTPYCYGGANLNCTDCSGFATNFYDVVLGIKIPRSADKQLDEASKVSESKLKAGDLVFFNIESKKASHVGVYLANGKFVHASTSKGVRIDDLRDKYYTKYFLSGGRIKN